MSARPLGLVSPAAPRPHSPVRRDRHEGTVGESCFYWTTPSHTPFNHLRLCGCALTADGGGIKVRRAPELAIQSARCLQAPLGSRESLCSTGCGFRREKGRRRRRQGDAPIAEGTSAARATAGAALILRVSSSRTAQRPELSASMLPALHRPPSVTTSGRWRLAGRRRVGWMRVRRHPLYASSPPLLPHWMAVLRALPPPYAAARSGRWCGDEGGEGSTASIRRTCHGRVPVERPSSAVSCSTRTAAHVQRMQAAWMLTPGA
jgi:hypothetical protein